MSTQYCARFAMADLSANEVLTSVGRRSETSGLSFGRHRRES